ncbi:MAG: hypothetical protein QXR53_02215 [Candidatus Norongarragalinales archaeon]
MNYEKNAFQEKAPYGVFIKVVLVCFLVLLAFLALAFQALVPQTPPLAKAVALFAIFAAAASLLLFFAMKFGADGKSVFAKIGPFAYRMQKKDFAKVSVMQKIPFWAGWGVRVWWWNGFTLAFVSQHKPSLCFEKKTGVFKKVVFSVSEPEDFARKAGLRLRP